MRYYTNNEIEFGWRNKHLTLMLRSENLNYEVSIDTINFLNFLREPKDIEDINNFAADNDIDQSDIQEILSSYIEKRIIKNSVMLKEDENLWFSYGWNSAMYYHYATRNVKYLDTGESGFENKEKELIDYISLKPPKKVFKKYPLPYKDIEKIDFNNLVPIEDLMLRRRTVRNFRKKKSSFSDLSFILKTSCQPLKVIREFVETKVNSDPLILTLSSYIPFEIYFFSQNNDQISDGLYHYNIQEEKISLLNDENYFEKLSKVAIGQDISNASFVFIISTVFERYMWRYRHSRALRNVYIECASLAHRFIFSSIAKGLGAFLTPALRDSMIDNIIQIDGYEEASTYLIAVG